MYPICPPTQVGVFPTAYATRGKMLRQSFNIRRISGKSNQLVSPEEMERVRHHTHSTEYHSCQPLSGVNLSPESANLYFPQAGWCLSFFAGGSGILNSNWHVWQWKEEAMCEIPMCNFKSHFSNKISQPITLGQSVCIWQWHVSAVRLTVFQIFGSV